MDCKEAKNYFVDLLSGEIAKRERKTLSSHLAMCTTCSQEKEMLEKVWRAIGNAPEVEVPEGLHQATISRIQEMLKAAQPTGLWRMPPELWIPKPLASVMASMAMAFFSLWVLRRVTALDQLSDEVIFLCSALWTGVLAASFLLATGSVPMVSRTWQRPSRMALTSLGFTMIGTMLCPKMSLIQWWESLPPGQLLLSLGEITSHVAFGVIYAFVPFFLAVLIFGRIVEGQLLQQILTGGGFFFFILVPVIYLQALPLSIDVFMSWVVGALIGAFMGGLIGASIFMLAPRTTYSI